MEVEMMKRGLLDVIKQHSSLFYTFYYIYTATIEWNAEIVSKRDFFHLQ